MLFFFQNMPTGSIEVVLNDFMIISTAKKQLPFTIRDFNKVSALISEYLTTLLSKARKQLGVPTCCLW